MDNDDTNEPDEFARLLAQLNGTAAQAPEPQQQPPAPAPSYTPPPAPSPAPATAPPAPPAEAPAPAAPQAAIAPAFGVAAPYPPLAGVAGGFTAAPPSTLSFPTVAPVPVSLPPEAPPLPRAPELMGADELAAPPRSFPPLDEPVPPLVSPPVADAPAYGAPAPSPELPQNPAPAYQPPLPSAPLPSAPLSSGPSSSMASAPAPSVPVLFVPDPAAPEQASAGPAAYGGAPAATSAPLTSPPRDFATLLSTPVGGDDESRSAAGPLRFGSSAPDDDDDEPDLARSTAGEKIGLVLAILIAPIGLIVGIAAAARSARRRGWVVGIVRASIAIAVVLTLVWGVAGYYGYTQLKLQQAHDQTAAASAAFCAAIKADPTMDQLPTFGWPAVAASIPDSLKAMQAYEDRWTKLAKVSPPGIKPGVTRMADAAKKIIDAVTVSRTVDDASNVSVISSTASSSGVQAWYSEYCG